MIPPQVIGAEVGAIEVAVGCDGPGDVALDGVPIEAVGRQIFEEILAVASGKKTKSEQSGVGEEEFAPWSIGPTL